MTIELASAAERLHARGLSTLLEPARSAVRVYRGPMVAGNRRADFEASIFLSVDQLVEVKLDAPVGWLSRKSDGTWCFEVAACIPRGPGDHTWTYANLDAAVEDILNYYFGDPAPMCEDWDSAIKAGTLLR